MLDIAFIREHKDIVENAVKQKGIKLSVPLSELIELSQKRKDISQKISDAKESLALISANDPSQKKSMIEKLISDLTAELSEIDKRYIKGMMDVPNIISPDTPMGDKNVSPRLIRTNGEKKAKIEKSGKEIASLVGLSDESILKNVSSNGLVRKYDYILLRNSLFAFISEKLSSGEFIDSVIKKSGYDINPRNFETIEIFPFAKKVVLKRTAYESDNKKISTEEENLVDTDAISPAILMDNTLEEDELPQRYVLSLQSGILEKDKQNFSLQEQNIELRSFSLPEYSIQEHEFLAHNVENILSLLGLSCEVKLMPAHSLSLAQNRAISIAVWSPNSEKYIDVCDVGLTTSFESRRLATRVRRVDGGNDLVHQCNAQIKIEKILFLLCEYFADEKFSLIKIPDVLKKYMYGREMINKAV